MIFPHQSSGYLHGDTLNQDSSPVKCSWVYVTHKLVSCLYWCREEAKAVLRSGWRLDGGVRNNGIWEWADNDAALRTDQRLDGQKLDVGHEETVLEIKKRFEWRKQQFPWFSGGTEQRPAAETEKVKHWASWIKEVGYLASWTSSSSSNPPSASVEPWPQAKVLVTLRQRLWRLKERGCYVDVTPAPPT